jgi:hypothetical protein
MALPARDESRRPEALEGERICGERHGVSPFMSLRHIFEREDERGVKAGWMFFGLLF